MALWDVYVGTFTKEFAAEIERLRSSSTDYWRGNAGNAVRAAPAVEAGAPYWPAGGGFSEGLEHFRFDDADGSLQHSETLTGDIANPQYLAVHPTLPVLYAVEYSRPARFLTFSIREDGTLERRSTTDSLGQLAVAVRVHPSGNVAYVGHWGDGTLSALRLDGDGMVSGAEVIARADPREGTRAFHHDVAVTPGGHALLITDVGGDDLTVYQVDPEGSVATPPLGRIDFPVGSGPRHIDFHPAGRFVFVVGEWDSMVYVLEADGGIPTKILNSYTTWPSDYEGKNKASELHLHPDGRTLYVGNRDHSSITIFSVDDMGGLETLGHEPSLGAGPASVKVHPTGRYLFVGNVYGGSIAVFRIGDDRLLEPVGEPLEARAPRYFTFVEARTG